jgi:hypothetical protein
VESAATVVEPPIKETEQTRDEEVPLLVEALPSM